MPAAKAATGAGARALWPSIKATRKPTAQKMAAEAPRAPGPTEAEAGRPGPPGRAFEARQGRTCSAPLACTLLGTRNVQSQSHQRWNATVRGRRKE